MFRGMPQDLGWGGPRQKRQDEYVGKRALFLEVATRGKRRQLVGIRPQDSAAIPTGAHFVPLDGVRRSLGFVTSSYESPTLGRPVALGLLEDGHALIGKDIGVFDNGRVRRMTVTSHSTWTT